VTVERENALALVRLAVSKTFMRTVYPGAPPETSVPEDYAETYCRVCGCVGGHMVRNGEFCLIEEFLKELEALFLPPAAPPRRSVAATEELVRLGCQDRRPDDPACLDPETGEHHCTTCDHENPTPASPKGTEEG
jgi:hypothetical protein